MANEYLAIDRGTFTLEQRRELGALLKSAMKSGLHQHGSRRCHTTQSHMHLQHYLPAKVWTVLQSEELLKNKFRIMAAFMCSNLGLRHPDEQTKRLAVVIVLLASELDPDANQSYQHLREFGALMEQKRSSIDTIQTLKSFPSDVNDFMATYPTAYGSRDPPVACRLDSSAIVERCRSDITPCRCTNSMVRRASSSSSHESAPAQSASAPSELATLMRLFMMSSAQKPSSDLARLYNAARQEQAAPSTAGSAPLALSDGQPAASSSTSLADADAVVSGGVAAPCLQPPEPIPSPSTIDKLAALSADIKTAVGEPCRRRMNKKGRGIASLATASPTARAKPASKSAGQPASTKGGRSQIKSSTGASKSAGQPASPEGGRSQPTSSTCRRRTKAELEARRAMLLQVTPKAGRPIFALKPHAYHGGRIYWQGAANAWRVYKRKSDRIDDRFPCKAGDTADMKQKFAMACAEIEIDPRPVV